VHGEQHVEPAEADDAVAARVRAGRGRERAGDDEREGRADEDERAAAQLLGDDLRGGETASSATRRAAPRTSIESSRCGITATGCRWT
jgi:hypothetical protein